MSHRSARTLRTVTLCGQRVSAVLVALLSLRALWDVAFATAFPAWFAPGFALGVVPLVALAAWTTFRPAGVAVRPGRGLRTWVWVLLALSVVATTSLHSFHPFRPGVGEVWVAWPGLRLNLVLAAGGVAAMLVGLALDLAGVRALALALLAVVCPLLLVPNDDCANPFNVWWIDVVGASPLMYVPTVIASVFGISALRGERVRLAVACIVATCAATLLLGLGHRTGVVW